MYKLLRKFLTSNLRRIPIMYIDFNYKKYKKTGKKKETFILNVHPTLRQDEYIIETMNIMAEYIKNNYDLDMIV